MKVKHIYKCLGMACSIVSFAGCSAWGPSTKGEAQFNQNSLEGQSKSLAGVYPDVGSDGSIKPHSDLVGTEGRVDGLIILGGPADMPNIKTGQNELKESANQTPKLRMRDKTFPSGSDNTGSSKGFGKP
jgi:hypothetical protein